MAAPFVGNQDYRGYLSYLNNQGDGNAGSLLHLVGNDAQFAGGAKNNTLYGYNQKLFDQYNQLSFGSPGPSYNSGGGGYAPVVAPPSLDINSIYGQARSKAEGAVNPFYTKQLQDFQTQQAAAKQQQDIQRQFNIQQLQQGLTNKLQENEISGQRTSQDVLQNEQQLGIQADRQQVDQGGQFDQARLAQAKQLATQGLTGSGIGAQQTLQAQTDRNTQEQRQGEDVQQQKQAQELFKSRTFEDLSRSGGLAKEAEASGEKQQQIDWDKFVQTQGFEYSNKQQQLEGERLARVAQETQSQGKLLTNQFIQSISNPAQRLAAAQAYGGLF